MQHLLLKQLCRKENPQPTHPHADQEVKGDQNKFKQVQPKNIFYLTAVILFPFNTVDDKSATKVSLNSQQHGQKYKSNAQSN